MVCDYCVERLVNKLKQFRRSATRYEQQEFYLLATVTIAAILPWLYVCGHAPVQASLDPPQPRYSLAARCRVTPRFTPRNALHLVAVLLVACLPHG
jgi:hypothetical protein